MRKEGLEVDARFGKQFAGRYVFQEITWAKRSRIIQKHTKYHPTTGQVQSSDFIAVQAETIWASLKEQPPNKPLSLEKLLSEDDGVPIELGELFSKVVNRLNGMTNEDVHFLSEQSDEESHTKLSQSFGSAKPSDGHPTNSQDSLPEPSKNSSSSSTS
jgi:hypothetical protein